MRIDFEHIDIEGFLSIGNASIDLSSNGLVLVSGINSNPADNSKSNGSGKSSLFEAIFYAATGNTIRGSKDKDIVNRNYPKGCKLELTIKRGDDIFKIVRSRNHEELGTRVMLFMNDEDISGKTMKDCDSTISQYLPELSQSIISSIVILGQGLPHKLTNYSPSGRKQLLEDLSQTSHLVEEVRGKLDTRKYLQNEALKKITSRRTEITVESGTLERIIKDIRGKMTYTTAEINADLVKIINEVGDASAKCADLKAQEEQFVDLTLRLSRMKSDAQTQYNQYYYRQQDLTKRISKLSNNICPTCGRLLDNSDQLIAEKEQATKELLEVNAQMELAKKEVDRIEGELSEVLLAKSGISGARTKADADLINLNSRLDSLTSTKAIIESAESDIAKHTARLDELKAELESLVPKENELNKSLNSLGYLDRAMSKEFKSYLLESVIDYLNKKISKYSRVLFSENYVQLVSNGNNLDITVNEKSYESLSGGERQKVDLCIQFALRDMLVNVTGFSCNILVLDEIFDNLDETGCDNLLKLLSELFCDIDSIYVITHHADIAVPYDKQIIVNKDFTNLSKVEVIEE